MSVRREKRNSRERILSAAAEIVGSVGSARLTLEAVADRAGLSKGGLLYNFPSKDALLQGMIQRLIDEAQAEKERLRRERPPSRNQEARLSCEVALKMRCGDMHDIATGMLAASAEDPRLLDPVRTALSEHWQRLQASEDPAAAIIAWLAVEGLASLEMHDINPVPPDERAKIEAAILDLLDRGIARDGVQAAPNVRPGDGANGRSDEAAAPS